MIKFLEENSIFIAGTVILVGLFVGTSYLQKASLKDSPSITGQNPIPEETNTVTPPVLDVTNPPVNTNTDIGKTTENVAPKDTTAPAPKKITRPLRGGDDDFEEEFEDD